MYQWMLDEQAEKSFHNPYNELTSEQQQLCEDFAWEYSGISPEEYAEERGRAREGWD